MPPVHLPPDAKPAPLSTVLLGLSPLLVPFAALVFGIGVAEVFLPYLDTVLLGYWQAYPDNTGAGVTTLLHAYARLRGIDF